MNEDLIQKFGYSEMYEWATVPDSKYRLGRFVTFDKDYPNKITPAKSASDFIVGITTVNSVLDSDDPNEWAYSNLCNEYGDIFLQKEKLAVGEKVYDQLSEMNYIRTYPWEHYVPIKNKYFNDKLEYVKRSNRAEWVRVNICGKAIVEDNGECVPGEFCMPYTGKIKPLQGTAVKADENTVNKFYVLQRLSPKTILILNK